MKYKNISTAKMIDWCIYAQDDKLIHRAENTHHFTVQLTSCSTILDLTKQVKLMQIQHKQSSRIQTK